jgi:hypothetical protein
MRATAASEQAAAAMHAMQAGALPRQALPEGSLSEAQGLMSAHRQQCRIVRSLVPAEYDVESRMPHDRGTGKVHGRHVADIDRIQSPIVVILLE